MSRRGAAAGLFYVGTCLPFAGALVYEAVNVACPWRKERVRTSRGDEFVVHAKRRPPPVGLVAYPAGRVLLEWCLLDPGDVDEIVEIGSGTGVFAIGAKRAFPKRRVVATDFLPEALANLRRNAEGLDIHVQAFDASREGLLPLTQKKRVRVVAADVVYVDAPADGLAATLADALARGASCRLVLVDRWSGGAHAVLAALAGVDVPSATRDPALDAFDRSLARAGLQLQEIQPDRARLLRLRLFATLDLSHKLAWTVLGTYDQMRCCDVVLVEKRLPETTTATDHPSPS